MTSRFLLLISLFALALLSCKKKDSDSPLVPNTDGSTGCGNFVVYKKLGTDKVVSIRIDQNKTTFSTVFQHFNNIANEPFASVELLQYANQEEILAQTCTDVILLNPASITHWTLLQGELRYKVSTVIIEHNCSDQYNATVVLENAIFQKNGSIETLVVPKVELKDVVVGWCAG